MLEVGAKAIARAQFFFERVECRTVGFGHRAARAAEQVMVMRMLVDFVLDAPVAEIGGVDKVEAREQIERAIHRRFVDRAVARPDAVENLLRSDVSIARADDGEDALTRAFRSARLS